jgi:hypothetical protein
VIFGKYSGNNYKFDSDYARDREKGCWGEAGWLREELGWKGGARQGEECGFLLNESNLIYFK